MRAVGLLVLIAVSAAQPGSSPCGHGRPHRLWDPFHHMRPADERAGLGSGLPGKCSDWDHPTVPPTQRAPVMLLPPLTGSWLEKRLTSSIEPWFICKDNAGWAQWWPPSLYSTNILPGYADCWANDATLRCAYSQGMRHHVSTDLCFH